jgi:hypothetical protein
MTTGRQNDELPEAVVAAIIAALAALEQPEETPEQLSNWVRSGRVAPSWQESGRDGWRERERKRG